MLLRLTTVKHRSDRANWLRTAGNEPRGYIQPKELKELWFHTGTNCNLSCPFCLEGSKPGDNRLNRIAFKDATPFIDEALMLGVQQFSFTGGEPFTVKDTVTILDYALDRRPCLVLTNATRPLAMRLSEVRPFLDKPNPLSFRISFDFPDRERHDAGRGKGNFDFALRTMGQLLEMGFAVSIARQQEEGEIVEEVEEQFHRIFARAGIHRDIRIVSFPDFLTPGSMADVPEITEDCMTRYHDDTSRDAFMCNFSKMVIKREGKMRVYACTLVDDDEDYDLGGSLRESMAIRVMLKHHRCYSCFAGGASCSEI